MGAVGKLPQGYKPKEFEPEILKFWSEKRIYEKIREASVGKPKFYFLDGPPYPSSGVPHIGTMWNKVIKDVVIRYRRARGFRVIDTPGYDCHGLPIEVKVEQSLKFRSKKDIEEYGVDRFVEQCKQFALKNAEGMTRHFWNFGVSMDWANPYLTLKNEYIESAWWLIKKAHERGLLERGVKVVHWCPRCETTLADYEVTEYRILEDPSIYVKLPVKGREKEYILIWTTTPWTLPANVAVMAHPDFEYALVEVGGEKLYILKDRVEAVMSEAGVSEYRVVKVLKGEELEGLEYEPPLADEVPVQRELKGAHRVVLSSEYVTAEEGTGLVHTAPGHGEEDFEVGQRYGLPVLAPVDDRGRFTKDAGKYAGLGVREANPVIIEDLRRKGLLFHASTIKHRYPVCWRCKTPLILRATPQWYIRVTQLKHRLLEEAERVRWIPEWAGYARFKNWLEGLRDWVISRQRYWGTPLPIWQCNSCGYTVVVGSLDELEKLAGRKLNLPDLHRPWVDSVTAKCPNCGGEMRRVPDVLDVWFDSGIAFFASLGYPRDPRRFEELWPADFIVEGHDQIAGWFFSLLRSGIIGFDRAPYKTVLMHGFALDETGREMHKSLGNYVSPDDVLAHDKGGRDVLRWFVLRNTVWEDLRFSWRNIDAVYDDLSVMWNVYYFASTYMSLDAFDPDANPLSKHWENLRPEDRWIVSRVERLTKEVTEYLENYLLHRAARALREFIVDDVSHWYIKLVRPRVWVERDDPDKLAAYATLYYVLMRFLVLSAPIVPFIAEKIYREAFRTSESQPESIHMLPWPEPRTDLIDDELEEEMAVVRRIVERGLAARMNVGIKVRQPLPALYVVTGDGKVAAAVEKLASIIKTQVNVKSVEVLSVGEASRFIQLRAKPVYSKLGPEFKSKAPLVAKLIGEAPAERLKKELDEKGSAVLRADGEEYVVRPEHVEFLEEVAEGYAVERLSENTLVVLDARYSEAELAEGFARDVLRRIQYMRKQLNLPVDAYVYVYVHLPEEAAKMLRKFQDYVASEARAKGFEIVDTAERVRGALVRDWEIGEYRVRIGIDPVESSA